MGGLLLRTRGRNRRMRRLHIAASFLALQAIAAGAAAQDAGRCRFLCAPKLKVEPTITIENLARRPRVVELPDGAPERVTREAEFEIIVSADIPTTLPRLGFTVEAIWTPFAGTSVNPFTGRTAEEIGTSEIRDNAVELEFEANLVLIQPEQTGGWLGSHFDIVDQFSPAERPTDRRAYTHKLNLELDSAVSVFNWLPAGNWLRNIEVEGSFDYLATGLPKRGDELRGERYLDDASRWSFSLVLVIPVAPW